MKWISVKDKLPDDTGMFIVAVYFRDTGEYLSMSSEFYKFRNPPNNDNDNEWGLENIDGKITHWMDFPELPPRSGNLKYKLKRIRIKPPSDTGIRPL